MPHLEVDPFAPGNHWCPPGQHWWHSSIYANGKCVCPDHEEPRGSDGPQENNERRPHQ